MGRMLKVPRRGFTLIELLVVIAIIGLLATGAVIAVGSAMKNSRDVRRKADLRYMQKALDLYYQENGAYPATPNWWGTCPDYGAHDISGSNGYIPNLAPRYIGQLPLDPRKGKTSGIGSCTDNQACYLYRSNGVDYAILAHCTPEGKMPAAGEPFYDPGRPTYVFKICNPLGASCAW